MVKTSKPKSTRDSGCEKCEQNFLKAKALERKLAFAKSDLADVKSELIKAKQFVEDAEEVEARFDEERERWESRMERLRDQLRAANRRAAKKSGTESPSHSR
jgi:chromosome segregation ATPase